MTLRARFCYGIFRLIRACGIWKNNEVPGPATAGHLHAAALSVRVVYRSASTVLCVMCPLGIPTYAIKQCYVAATKVDFSANTIPGMSPTPDSLYNNKQEIIVETVFRSRIIFISLSSVLPSNKLVGYCLVLVRTCIVVFCVTREQYARVLLSSVVYKSLVAPNLPRKSLDSSKNTYALGLRP